LVKLYSFTINFLKKIGECIILSFVKDVIKAGITAIVNFLSQFLTGGLITVFKAVWYLGKFTYYIAKALDTDYTRGTDQEKNKAKQTVANYYGKATGSFINIGLSIIALAKKKILKKSK